MRSRDYLLLFYINTRLDFYINFTLILDLLLDLPIYGSGRKVLVPFLVGRPESGMWQKMRSMTNCMWLEMSFARDELGDEWEGTLIGHLKKSAPE